MAVARIATGFFIAAIVAAIGYTDVEPGFGCVSIVGAIAIAFLAIAPSLVPGDEPEGGRRKTGGALFFFWVMIIFGALFSFVILPTAGK